MRIPLVSHVRVKHALIFASALLVAQLLEHTNTTFAVLVFCYIIISTLAFNAAGGLVYPSGSYVFFNVILGAVVGLVYKIFLFEPAESNLRAPIVSMMVYCGSMVATGLAAALTRRLTRRKALLSDMTAGDAMKHAAIGALLLGVVLQTLTFETEEGTLFSALRQINQFIPMSIILATFYQVRKSGGRKSSNWIVWSGVLFLFITGTISTSKQGILTGPVTWLGAAIISGHSFSRKQILGVILAGAFFQTYLAPYSQVSRNFLPDPQTFVGDAQNAWRFLSDLGGTRQTYILNSKEAGYFNGMKPHLYDDPQGFWDRLSILPADDALIAYTEQGNYEGLTPTYEALLNIIPHVIWKDKPVVWSGNQYARETGIISDENVETGVSFSPEADAYHQVGWYGIFLLLPAVLLFMFMVLDSLSGDIRQAPWGILFCVLLSHGANEGAIGFTVYIATTAAFGVVVIALASKYLLPFLGKVAINSARSRVTPSMTIRPVLSPRPQIATAAPSASASQGSES